jgi:hypothetical protein
MPTTMHPNIVITEEYKLPEVKPEAKEKVVSTIVPKNFLAQAEIDQKSEGGLLDSQPDEDNMKLNLAAEIDTGKSIWGKPVKQPKEEKWISYDELKKDFKYDDKSTLPILDKPLYDVSDVIETGSQEKDFSPVAMPKRFVSYDKNRDGFISIKELQKVTGAVENSDKAFKDTDVDGK